MGKHKYLTGTVPSYDPTEREVRVGVATPVLPIDLAGDLHQYNASDILTVECTHTSLRPSNSAIIPSFNLVETQIYANENLIIPSFNLTQYDLQEINNSEVLSFELRDYDQEQLVYKVVLEFFNESGGVF